MRIGYQTGIGAALLIAATSAVFATNRSVCPTGCQYTTIQSAIDAAVNGDVIQIAKGRYVENLVISGKRITLQGQDRRSTVVDGNGQGTVVTIGDRIATTPTMVALSDLTLTRGYGANGGGIVVFEGGSLVLRHSTVVANHSEGDGGGINVTANGGQAVTIADSTITNNDAVFWGGGINATGEEGTFSIVRCTVSQNRAGGFGGGIALAYDGATLNVTDTDIVDNTAKVAGGVFGGEGAPNSNLTLQNVVVNGNSASAQSGGLDVAGNTTLQQVVVAHNIAGTTGGGLTASPGFRGGGVALSDVYVVQNKAGTQGGGIMDEGGLEVPLNTVVASNLPDNCAAQSQPGNCQ